MHKKNELMLSLYAMPGIDEDSLPKKFNAVLNEIKKEVKTMAELITESIK